MTLAVRRVPTWVVAIVALQVLVPGLVLVWGDPPSRYGFQMYSGVGGFAVEAFDAQGEQIEVPEDLIAQERPEIDWRLYLPEHLCLSLRGTHEVVLETAEGKESFTC